MNERISALLDGELSGVDCGECIDRVGSAREARQTWDAYVLIGDTLRGHAGPDCASRVAERLRSEPTVIAPPPVRRPALHPAWPVFAAAAGVAAVAAAAWMMLPPARLEAPAIARAPVSAPQPEQSSTPPASAPAATGVDNYLLAHQRFSPSLAMQGVAPYVRTVSQEQRR